MKLLKMACVPFAFILVIFLLGASAQNDGNQKGKSDDVNGDATKGKKVFEENCVICHDISDREKVGPGLKGISKKGPDKLSDGTEHKDHSPGVLHKQIVEGGGAMPPVGASFSDKEVDDLIAYLMTL